MESQALGMQPSIISLTPWCRRVPPPSVLLVIASAVGAFLIALSQGQWVPSLYATPTAAAVHLHTARPVPAVHGPLMVHDSVLHVAGPRHAHRPVQWWELGQGHAHGRWHEATSPHKAERTLRLHSESQVRGIPQPHSGADLAAVGGLALLLMAFAGAVWPANAQAIAIAAVTSEAVADEADEDAPGWMMYDVTVRRPLGLVLEENRTTPSVGAVLVAECIEGGNGAAAGIQPGDVLRKCSAVTLKSGPAVDARDQGDPDRPDCAFNRVRFDTRGETFDTVMAALGSNSERWGYFDVALTFVRRSDQA